MGAFALRLLMLDNAHALDIAAAINAWDLDVGANRLMALNLLSNALGLAVAIRLTFERRKVAEGVMGGHLLVLEHVGAAHFMVAALELHFVELLLHLFLDAEELGLFALHWTHARLVMKFLKTLVMEPILARFALHRVNKNCLAKCAEEFGLQLVLRQKV